MRTRAVNWCALAVKTGVPPPDTMVLCAAVAVCGGRARRGEERVRGAERVRGEGRLVVGRLDGRLALGVLVGAL